MPLVLGGRGRAKYLLGLAAASDPPKLRGPHLSQLRGRLLSRGRTTVLGPVYTQSRGDFLGVTSGEAQDPPLIILKAPTELLLGAQELWPQEGCRQRTRASQEGQYIPTNDLISGDQLLKCPSYQLAEHRAPRQWAYFDYSSILYFQSTYQF